MNQIESLNATLQELGRRHAIPDLLLDYDGTVSLQLNSGLTLYLEYVESQQKLFVYCVLMPLPKHAAARASLCEAMLELNCLESGTGGGVLVIDRTDAMVLFQAGLDAATLDVDGLDRTLSDLAQRKDSLSHKLDQASHMENGKPSPGPRNGRAHRIAPALGLIQRRLGK